MGAYSFRKIDTHVLVDCAMGRLPADLVIQNGNWVCVQSGEIIPKTDIAIKYGRIAYVGPNARHTLGPETRVIQAEDRYLTPGLLDAHVHIESSMLTVTEFVRAVMAHGTTGVFIDPHEIANLFGLDGVRMMLDEALVQPIHVFVQMPSCVPSAPEFETPGAILGPEDVKTAYTWPNMIGLGEMMDFNGVLQADRSVLEKIELTHAAGKVVSGHFPIVDFGALFHGYLAAGIHDDHEGTTKEGAIARARQGMKVLMRYGSAWHDVAAQIKAVTEARLDPRNFLLCTDDCHSETLVREGHIDRVLREAIKQGLSPVTGLQMATINTATHFSLDREIGQIAPTRCADILIVNDLDTMEIEKVIAKGEVVFEEGQVQSQRPVFCRDEKFTHSLHLPLEFKPSDFTLVLPQSLSHRSTVKANVIEIIENQASTRHLKLEVPVKHVKDLPGMSEVLAKVAVVERNHGSGMIQLGLVKGFQLTSPCALASTVVHDCHQLIVIGTDDANMALAVNALRKCGGGQVVVKNGEVIGLVALPIAGLMSEAPAEIVSKQLVDVLNGIKSCGCKLNNPNMQMSLLALAVIPELRLTDRGLVDVINSKFLAVFE